MHKGGAYPSSAPQDPTAANAWAWSPAGINAAMSDMSKVAQGQTGAQAVHSLVYKFERPNSPAPEYANAMKIYQLGVFTKAGGVTGAVQSAAGYVPASIGDAAGTVASSAGAVTSFLGDLTSPSFWIRALEIVGGGILFLLGIYLLTRQVGLNYSPVSAVLPQAAKDSADAAAPTPAPRSTTIVKHYPEPAESSSTRRQRLDAKYGTEAPY